MDVYAYEQITERLKRIEGMLINLAQREDAARARQEELLVLVRDAYSAQQVEISALREALATADTAAQARVDAALAEDSDFDATKVEQGNAALEELLGLSNPDQPTEPTV